MSPEMSIVMELKARKWQNSLKCRSQKPVLAREWKFDSSRPHQLFNPFCYNNLPPLFGSILRAKFSPFLLPFCCFG